MNGKVRLWTLVGCSVTLLSGIGGWAALGLPIPVSGRTLDDHDSENRLQFAQMSEKQAEQGIEIYSQAEERVAPRILYWTQQLAQTTEAAARREIEQTLSILRQQRAAAARKVEDYRRQKVQASQ